jgi:predicted component of type VI protein secretion system
VKFIVNSGKDKDDTKYIRRHVFPVCIIVTLSAGTGVLSAARSSGPTPQKTLASPAQRAHVFPHVTRPASNAAAGPPSTTSKPTPSPWPQPQPPPAHEPHAPQSAAVFARNISDIAPFAQAA